MEINQNPLELLTAKVRETVADTQNLANEIAAKVEESATVLTAWVQSAPSSMVSAGAIATQEAFKIAHNIRFENLPTNLQFKLARAGMREGIRNVQEAAKVFESIPAQIRAQGPEAIRNFCQDKDWIDILTDILCAVILDASLTDATPGSLTLSLRPFIVVAMPYPDFVYIFCCILISLVFSTTIQALNRADFQVQFSPFKAAI